MEVNSENPVIQLVELRKQFRTMSGPVTALGDISLEVQYEEMFGITGLSDVGKSTLVRCINYLEVPTSGKIIFEGKNLSVIRNREKRLVRQSMGTTFQQFNLLFQGSVLQNACLPPETAGVSKTEAKKWAGELLTPVGLEDRMKVYPAQLSGRQKRKVAITEAMATSPKVFLCDETTSALDPNTTRSILELLRKIDREMGITVTVIARETAVIETICDRVTVTNHSHITEAGNVSGILPSPESDIDRQPVLGDMAKQNLSFGNSHQTYIVFDGRESSKPMIVNMVLACKVPVSIMHTDIRGTESKAVGRMLIQLPEGGMGTGRICNYLKTANVKFEEVRRDAV